MRASTSGSGCSIALMLLAAIGLRAQAQNQLPTPSHQGVKTTKNSLRTLKRFGFWFGEDLERIPFLNSHKRKSGAFEPPQRSAAPKKTTR